HRVTTGPLSPPLRRASREVRSRPPRVLSPPWHLTQFSSSSGRTCLTKPSAPRARRWAWSGGSLSWAGAGAARRRAAETARRWAAIAKHLGGAGRAGGTGSVYPTEGAIARLSRGRGLSPEFGEPGVTLPARQGTAARRAATCAGVVPQQPPIIT